MLLAFAEGAVAGGSFTVSVDVHRQAEVQEDVGGDQGAVEEEGKLIQHVYVAWFSTERTTFPQNGVG